MEDKFKKEISIHEIELKKISKVFNIIGYIKIFTLIVFIYVLYLAFSNNFSLQFSTAGLIIFLLQIVLWVYHEKIQKKVNYSAGMITVYKKYLDRLTGDWINFTDIGNEFIDTNHQYAYDLDIVGNKSLFQFLNSTNTWHGRQIFANDLLNPNYDDIELLKRQKAVGELSEDIDFSAVIQYYLSKIGIDDSILKLLDMLQNNEKFTKYKFIKLFLMYCPIFSIIFITAIIIFKLKNFYVTGATIILLQTIFWVIGSYKIYKYLNSISNLPYKLSNYKYIPDMLQNKEFHSEKLVQIKNRLTSVADAINNLSNIFDKISIRHNVVLYFLLNIFLLWDYECVFAFENWKLKYSKISEDWFIALGELESLLSFSNMASACNKVSFPNICKNEKVFDAFLLGHPLITNNIRVCNNITENNSILIISGSNMSGKTTFLRTIGINLVLANAGGFVCAKTMNCSIFKIMTSMRIVDDLSDGVSTFYAELKKIKRIIDLSENTKDVLFLIDEIFRGTNSIDRLYGAKTVISKLNSLETMGIITTHDLELCQLAEQHPRIKNYSFSEYYKNNKILFDYKLNIGKSNTTNAKYLMQMIGILQDKK